MDKLDRINEKKFIRKNLVKWWDVNMTESILIGADNADEEDFAAEDMFEEEVAAAENAEAAEPEIDTSNISQETLDTANEIYARLMAEAAADEAAKQAEIEAAKMANS